MLRFETLVYGERTPPMVNILEQQQLSVSHLQLATVRVKETG